MSESGLRERVVIVTGASSGIGRATALELGRAGARVVVAARRRERIDEVAGEIVAAGSGSAIAVPTDVTDEGSIERLVSAAIAEYGAVDGLVAAAGQGAFAPVAKLRVEDLDRLWAVNVRGAILAAKHVAPILAAQRRGALVFVGSVSSKRGWPQGTPYVATKFALRGAAECLRAELRPAGVRVVHVCPDFTDTGFFAASGVQLSGKEGMLAAGEVAATIRFALELPRGADLTELDLIPGPRG